ncbi:MAG: hypothetical protein ACTSYB_10300 [Candidatus Helarchaeota archaeon]
MNRKILIISVIILVGALSSSILLLCSIHQNKLELLLYDEFTSESAVWYWRHDGTGRHSLNNSIAEFWITNQSTNTTYSNSEIYNNNELPYYHVRLIMRIRSSNLTKGSRGWGLWNRQMSATQSELIWFMYMEGNATYPYNGFYAFIQLAGGAFSAVQLLGIDLLQWHIYQIDWNSLGIFFYVDNNLVSFNSTLIPTATMAFHFWVDNAVYDYGTVFTHIYQNIDYNTSIYIDYLKIFQFV